MQFPRTARLLATLIALLIAPGANAATELFQSDFGGTVHMGTPNLSGGTNGWWPILGGDDGFNWPITTQTGLRSLREWPNTNTTKYQCGQEDGASGVRG